MSTRGSSSDSVPKHIQSVAHSSHLQLLYSKVKPNNAVRAASANAEEEDVCFNWKKPATEPGSASGFHH